MKMRVLVGLVGLLSLILGTPARAFQPEEVLTVKAVSQVKKVHAGDQFAIAVVVDFNEGWHIWPSQNHAKDIPAGVEPYWTTIGPIRKEADGDKPQPTLVKEAVYSAWVGGIQWEQPALVTSSGFTGSPLKVPSYKGTVVMFIPVTVPADAPLGVATLEWGLGFQPCNDSICMGMDTQPFTASWEVVPTDQPSEFAVEGALFSRFDPKVFGKFPTENAPLQPLLPTGAKRAEFDFFGYKFTIASNQYLLIFVIAFVAGVLLNLTPCVLPVIPIKVLSLQKQAGNPTKLALYGSVYCLGIVAMFAVLGVLIAVMQQQWGQLFSKPWFAGLMGLIVLVMGIGMMGVFTFKLPQAVYMVNPAGDTVQGNFMMGVLTAILSTPCTGPFFGATLAWAATQPSWVGCATLTCVGAGMAFPYGLLIAFPKLIDRMPRSGPGGELLKQVLGVLMVAVSAFLFSNLIHREWMWWVTFGIAAAGFVWAIVRAPVMLRTTRSRVIVSAIAVLGMSGSIGLGYTLTRPSGIPWKTYALPADGGIQKAIDDAHAAHKFVVVKFTATWCGNCHTIERTVYNSKEGVRELNRADVASVKVDLTDEANKEGWALLRSMSGGSGIPFSVFVPPVGEPVQFRSFFKISDLVAALKVKTASNTP